MKNKILIVFSGVFVIMIGLIVYVNYRSNPLEFDQSIISHSLNDNELVCLSFSKEQITTFEEYEFFLDACHLSLVEPLEETYFNQNTLVILLEESNEKITHIYDYGFMINDTEILTYRAKKSDESALRLTMIYASRKQIVSENVIFDKIW